LTTTRTASVLRDQGGEASSGNRLGFAWTLFWVSGVRAGMLVCSLLGALIVYRQLAALDPSLADAGRFAIAMAGIRFLTNSIGSAGDLSMLRRVPVLHGVNPEAAAKIVRAAFVMRVAAVVALALVATVGRSWFGAQFFGGAQHAHLVFLIVAAAAAELLLRAVLAYFQATERFGRFVAFEALFQGSRLIVTLGLVAAGALSVDAVLVAYAALGIAAGLFGATRLPGRLFRLALDRSAMIEVSRFYLWTLFALLLSACNERIDLFLLGRLSGAREAGLYGGILSLAVIPDFLVGLLATVLQPRIIDLYQRGELRRFWARLLLGMVPCALVGSVVTVCAGSWFVGVALGPRYAAGATAFVLVALGSLVWLVLTPVPAAMITLSAPRLTTALTILQLVLLAGGCLLAIPRFGLLGAAATAAGVRSVMALCIVGAGWQLMGARLGTAAAAESSIKSGASGGRPPPDRRSAQ
jgi:O-antigen/teichoic acid export membrane protein